MTHFKKLHSLTQHQIKTYLPEGHCPEELTAFIDSINAAYCQADEDKANLEKSIASSTQALTDQNAELQQQITELSTAQDALKESHSLLHASLVSSHDAILVLDLKGNYYYLVKNQLNLGK